MPSRRAKVPPAPLYNPDVSAVAGGRSPSSSTVSSHRAPHVSDFARTGQSGSPTSASSPSSKGRASMDHGGLPVEERIVVADHVTNSGAVVTLTRMDHSGVMRAYRVCRQSHVGAAADAHPLLKLFTVNDMLLVALTFAVLLHTAVRGSEPVAAPRQAVPFRAPMDSFLAGHVRLALIVACPLLLLCRLLQALRRVYVEEVLAIRGIGIQFTTYGIFNGVKTKEFIDLRLVRSIVIHDAFWRYQPIFTLTSSIENRGTRIVYFDNVLPRLEVLRPVLCGIRHILFEEPEEGPSLADAEAALHLETVGDADSGVVSRDTDSALDDSFATQNASDVYEGPVGL